MQKMQDAQVTKSLNSHADSNHFVGSGVPVVGQYVYGDKCSTASCQISVVEINTLHSCLSMLL